MYINKERIINTLEKVLIKENLIDIRKNIDLIKSDIKSFKSDDLGLLNIGKNGDTISIRQDDFIKDLNQIEESFTLERSKYYINRLIKSLKVKKTNKVNDINLNRWRDYPEILTDSLWIMNKRDNTGAHNAKYWGNFIPQIPNQFINRYTKKGDWVLDTFLGSGTTMLESRRLERNCIGVELQTDVAKIAKENLKNDANLFTKENKNKIIIGDSSKISYREYLNELNIDHVQLIIMHPPYWDIIKFSENPNDLSNAKSIEDFLKMFREVINNSYEILEKGRYLVIVIGDKYQNSEWIPLGFYCMQEALNRGYKLTSTIVKNFEETKGKQNQQELWRYRALVGGFYIFKHEYIFLLKK